MVLFAIQQKGKFYVDAKVRLCYSLPSLYVAQQSFLVLIHDVDAPHSVKRKKLLSSYRALSAQGAVRNSRKSSCSPGIYTQSREMTINKYDSIKH